MSSKSFFFIYALCFSIPLTLLFTYASLFNNSTDSLGGSLTTFIAFINFLILSLLFLLIFYFDKKLWKKIKKLKIIHAHFCIILSLTCISIFSPVCLSSQTSEPSYTYRERSCNSFYFRSKKFTNLKTKNKFKVIQYWSFAPTYLVNDEELDADDFFDKLKRDEIHFSYFTDIIKR